MQLSTRYSPLFINDGGGGVLCALPYEAITAWNADEDYDALLDRCEELVQVEPLGESTVVVVNDLDGEGILEAHWAFPGGTDGAVLAVWGAWPDPARPSVPENLSRVGRRWLQGQDPRQGWLDEQLRRPDLEWERHARRQLLPSGVLFLAHPEWPTANGKLAKPGRIAKCGQLVPAGLRPGVYHVESVLLDELPEGEHLCALCRWVPAEG